MKIKITAVVIAAIGIISACQKYPQSYTVTKTKTDLLTQKTWFLVSYGVDNNNNGLIDNSEESIQLCQKDNTYTFYADGTGLVAENGLVCNSNSFTNHFQWSLLSNGTKLDFINGTANLVMLTQDTMILSDDANGSVKHLFIYKH